MINIVVNLEQNKKIEIPKFVNIDQNEKMPNLFNLEKNMSNFAYSEQNKIIPNIFNLEQNKKIVYFEDEPFDEGKEDEHDIEFKEALDVLDEKYRVVTVLYYSQGFSTKEISRILNIPDNTVRTRLSRAREQLKKYYEEQSV